MIERKATLVHDNITKYESQATFKLEAFPWSCQGSQSLMQLQETTVTPIHADTEPVWTGSPQVLCCFEACLECLTGTA